MRAGKDDRKTPTISQGRRFFYGNGSFGSMENSSNDCLSGLLTVAVETEIGGLHQPFDI